MNDRKAWVVFFWYVLVLVAMIAVGTVLHDNKRGCQCSNSSPPGRFSPSPA